MKNNTVYKLPTTNSGIINATFTVGECGGALCGIVLDEAGQPSPKKAACLYKWSADGGLNPVDCAFSDEDGQFVLGPLSGDDTYYVKVSGCVACEFGSKEAVPTGENDSFELYEKYKGLYGE